MGNISINDKSREIGLTFNKSFYDSDVIKASADSFKDICKAKIKDGDPLQVTLSQIGKDIDPKILGYEFFNYVLGSMKHKTIC